MDIATDPKNQNIILNIVEVLKALKTSAPPTAPAAAVFKSVLEYDDLESFKSSADALSGPICGIIGNVADRDYCEDNSAIFVYRLPIQVAVLFPAPRAIGQDESNATAKARAMASLIRSALLSDRSRGGNAERIVWKGSLLDGTDVNAQASLSPRVANQAFYTLVVPAACGWTGNYE